MESMVYVCMVTIVSCSNIFNDTYMRAMPVYLELFCQHECLLRHNVSGVKEIEKRKKSIIKVEESRNTDAF